MTLFKPLNCYAVISDFNNTCSQFKSIKAIILQSLRHHKSYHKSMPKQPFLLQPPQRKV